MSIPPLVCSTPPPPEQCEDDKDPEDFDLQYNLSQEDYDENYDYGNFSTYNHLQSSSVNQKPDSPTTIKIIENHKNSETSKENTDNTEIVLGTNLTSESKSKFEEEINIEDLNLKVDEEPIEKADSKDSSSVESETSSHKIDCNIPDNTNPVRQDEANMSSEEFPVVIPSIGDIKEPPIFEDEINDELDDLKVDISENIVSEELPSFDSPKTDTSVKESEEHSNKLTTNVDDDFGDFDDFQFANNDSKPTTIVESCDNPWDSKVSEDNDFGDFKANFDENLSNLSCPPEIQIEHSNDDSKFQTQVEENDDDDFGEFDDFKSSANEIGPNIVTDESLTCQDVPVLNLHTTENENQFIENINKLLSDIFEQEIPEPESEFEGNLESVLGETWGHLLETDVRQPYMVNWNNSTGQKTLLKALCIDSRNILFGPKWSYNMPKYAANLSSAPLQPQKQSTSANVMQNEPVNTEKIGTKPTNTWSDPFISEDQESCNTDNGSGTPVIETGPTDLDVFEAAVSSKSDNIYSSTINVQPLRQINLPDTHIFTPTDSETPRSKTIHYDSSPTVLLPQAVTENDKNQPEPSQATGNSNAVTNSLEDDSDYWEFQDFKGSDISTPSTSQHSMDKAESATSNTLNTAVTYGTQVLQPIKIEPIIPTLNWPDPGEIKETFDDFSDFVSNSTSWNTEKQNASPTFVTPTPQLENSEPFTGVERAGAIIKNTIISNEQGTSNISENFDDEFDTFQSALPSKSSLEDFNFSSSSAVSKPSNTSPVASQKNSDLDNVFLKSDSISIAHSSRLHEISTSFTPNNLSSSTKTELAAVSSPAQPSNFQLNSNLLQPTQASSSTTLHNQQKSAQILQPLSLESYSQINWPNPGIDLQDLSRFNPVETLQSLKSDLSTNSQAKLGSPIQNHKSSANHQVSDDDIWGEFVSSKPKPQQALPKKSPAFVDDDEWTDFVSSPSVKPQNGLNTISLNVHSQKSINQGKFTMKTNQIQLDIPTLNYITPKSGAKKSYNDRHFQNL